MTKSIAKMSVPLAAAIGAAAIWGTAAASQGSSPITGIWETGSQGGRVQIYRCGSAICGKIIGAAPLRANPDARDTKNPDKALREKRLMGLVVLHGFKGGPAEWSGGPVYDPETGEGAKIGYLTLRADGRLEVKGCKAIFCRSKMWKRSR
jgi:uncharacterized protein (DUF2147 family)